ncbi:MAG: hypothetical protein OES13_07990, partial [Acidimicrobiia bacterium]|nr:hypothetical protein [Acidimicrobiia bacterium]
SVRMRLYDQGAFHLDDEDRPGGWDPDLPIRIRARLRSAFTRGHDDAEQWFELFMGDDNGPLRHSEAWLMTEATRAVPVPGDVEAFSSIGIRTRWAPSFLE